MRGTRRNGFERSHDVGRPPGGGENARPSVVRNAVVARGIGPTHGAGDLACFSAQYQRPFRGIPG